MANSVSVQLTANDLVSPAILDIKKQLDSLGAKASFKLSLADLGSYDLGKLRQGMSLFSEATETANHHTNNLGMMLSGMGAGFAMAGIQLAIDKIREFIGAVDDASKLQTQAIATSSDISTNLGVSFDHAKGIVEETQVQIAKAAAALPGVTADYNRVFNAISGTIASQLRGQDKLFEQIAIDITKRTGVLASIRHADPGFSGDIMNRLIAGTSTFGEAMHTELFEKNPQLINAIRGLATKYGIDVNEGWKQLSTKTRLALLQQGLRIATPDSLISAFDGTVESMVQNIQTALFDPQIGVFGMLRKVKASGGRSVLDGVQNLLQAITNLSDSAGKVMDRLGLRIDPLAPVIGFLDWLSDLTNGFNSFIYGRYIKLPVFSLDGIGATLGSGINAIKYTLIHLLEGVNWQDFGNGLYALTKWLVRELGSFFMHLDYAGLARLLRDALAGILDTFTGFLYSALDDLWSFIKGGFEPAITTVQGIIDNIIGFFQQILQWFQRGVQQVQSFTQPITTAVSNATADPLGTAGKVLDSVVKPVENGLNDAGGLIGGILFPDSSTNNTSHQTINNHITVNGGNGSAEDIAGMLFDRLSDMYKMHQNKRLATP